MRRPKALRRKDIEAKKQFEKKYKHLDPLQRLNLMGLDPKKVFNMATNDKENRTVKKSVDITKFEEEVTNEEFLKFESWNQIEGDIFRIAKSYQDVKDNLRAVYGYLYDSFFDTHKYDSFGNYNNIFMIRVDEEDTTEIDMNKIVPVVIETKNGKILLDRIEVRNIIEHVLKCQKEMDLYPKHEG